MSNEQNENNAIGDFLSELNQPETKKQENSDNNEQLEQPQIQEVKNNEEPIATKLCPYCGETINIRARKCKYCGEWLVEQENSHVSYKVVKKVDDDFRNKFCMSTWIFALLSSISSGLFALFWIIERRRYLNDFSISKSEKIGATLIWFLVLCGILYSTENSCYIAGDSYNSFLGFLVLYSVPLVVLGIIINFKLAKLYENYIEKTHNKKIHLNRFLVYLIAPYYINHTANTIEDRL